MSFRNGSGPDPRLPYDPGPMTRVFSGMKPTGDATLGSLLGALRNWVTDQNRDAFYCVVDLHAITMGHDPVALRNRTRLSVANDGHCPRPAADLHRLP